MVLKAISDLVLPTEKSGGSDHLFRQRVFVAVSTLIMIPLCLYFMYLEWRGGDQILLSLLSAGCVLMTVCYICTRSPRYSNNITRFVLIYMIAVILYQITLDRGPHTLFLTLLTPWLSFFFFGRREGWVWSTSMLAIASVYTFFPNQMGVPSLIGAGTDYVATYILMSFFAATFERLRQKAMIESETRHKQLTEEQAQLEAVQEELRKSENRFRMFADVASDWLFQLDDNLCFTFISPRFEEIMSFPLSDLLGTRVTDMFSNPAFEAKDPQLELLENHLPFRDYPLKIRGADGNIIYTLIRAEPLFDSKGNFTGYMGSAANITNYEETRNELRDKERVLHHTQKIDALGQLTSGVAHDFNNLLTVISGNLELLRIELGTKAEPELLDAAEAAAQRAADLTRQLLSFARNQPLSPRTVDVDELLSSMTTMLKRTLGSSIRLTFTAEEQLWHCRIDPSQLESAILNLALNARDAMGSEGTLTIQASNLPAGDYPEDFIEISVKDTGVGIEPDILTRIIEPFFTTKPLGEGTGLGLSMVYGFVNQSGGHFDIKSVPGEGTCVTLLLPRAKTTSPSQEDATTLNANRTTRILLVEDEPDLRKLLTRMLTKQGHDIQVVADATEARDIFCEFKPDLVISDIMLGPGENGVELTEEFKEQSPDTRVLLISGFPQDALENRKNKEKLPSLLTKPFTSAQLSNAVQKALSDRP